MAPRWPPRGGPRREGGGAENVQPSYVFAGKRPRAAPGSRGREGLANGLKVKALQDAKRAAWGPSWARVGADLGAQA